MLCDICAEDKNIPSEKVTAQCPGDRQVCQDCLQHHIENFVVKSKQVRSIPCICNSSEDCDRKLQWKDIRLHASSDIFAKYDDLLALCLLERNREFRWCPNPECGVGQLIQMAEDAEYENDDDNVDTGCNQFSCHACGTTACFVHDCEWTKTGNVDGGGDVAAGCPQCLAKTESDLLANKLIYRRCPECRNLVEKNGGCDCMVCRCGHNFCWCCRASYLGELGINNIGNSAHSPHCRNYE